MTDSSCRTYEQVLAANIDTAFLVSGLDNDFNIRRIERYLLTAYDSGATPVVVLNKSDLCDNIDEHVAEIESVACGVEVCAVSAIDGNGMDGLKTYLKTGKTVDYVIDLKPGEYLYSCPLNPTPNYPLIVED